MENERVKRPTNESSGTSTRARTIDKEIESSQWVTFSINNELFAVDTLQVKEILRYTPITPVPGTNAYICGLINLRGHVVTVIDTRMMFNLPHEEPNDNTNILLVDFSQDEMVGFVVDSVGEVINIATKSIDVAPRLTDSDTKSGFIKGVTMYDNSLIILLDIEKIISYVTPIIEDDPY